MTIPDLVAGLLDRPISAIRRHAISLAIAVVAAIAALLYAASAMMLALELVLGPIGARLLVAAALLLVAVIGYFAPRLFGSSPARAETAPAELEGLSRDQRIAMVFEALMLGFSMGSRKPAESADAGK